MKKVHLVIILLLLITYECKKPGPTDYRDKWVGKYICSIRYYGNYYTNYGSVSFDTTWENCDTLIISKSSVANQINFNDLYNKRGSPFASLNGFASIDSNGNLKCPHELHYIDCTDPYVGIMYFKATSNDSFYINLNTSSGAQGFNDNEYHFCRKLN